MPTKTDAIFDMDNETTCLDMEIDITRALVDRLRELSENAEKYLKGRQDADLPRAIAMLDWQLDRVADCRERMDALVTIGFERAGWPDRLKVAA